MMETTTMRRHTSTQGSHRSAFRLFAGLVAAVTITVTAGCAGNNGSQWYAADGKPAAATGPEKDAGAPINVAVTAPTEGATNVSTATEIAYTTDAPSSTVELMDATGAKIDGELRPDRSSWVPAKQLDWSTRYTAKITGTGPGGRVESRTTTFTTMARPGNTAKVSSNTSDGQVVGVGMPLIVDFSSDIPKEQRANVQRRMFVASNPPQDGIWYWWSNHEVHYRPKEYWQSGTTVSARIAIGGLPLGGNRFGAADLTLSMKIGAQIIMEADNATKQMTVKKDGQLLRTMPVSFGKHSTPSDSGSFIVMIKNDWEWFDSTSFGIPSDSPGGYRTKVYFTQRITWDGKYIHSAPWSEGDQGKRNVSHGCTNVSAANAEWLFHLTQIGDPVIIKGTETHVDWQNGWTDWDRSWDEYVKGSAIPYTPMAAPLQQGPAKAA
jgi:lipoprotein-anchoring transpeptidase ErfK/SrfK